MNKQEIKTDIYIYFMFHRNWIDKTPTVMLSLWLVVIQVQ